jgi:hypothetical protein
MRLCSIDGCNKPHDARGWCDTHYARWKRFGNPLTVLIAAHGDALRHGYRIYAGKMEHIAIVERVMGKRLPKGAVIHHVNENRADNRHTNLVVCSRAFHQVIHARTRAYDECGHADWKKCQYCGKYDDPSKMYVAPNHPHSWHRECRRIHWRFRTTRFDLK